MLGLGQPFPAFDLKAVVSNDPSTAVEKISSQSHPGQWKVIMFYPKDFTFVCPTEIVGFAKHDAQFKQHNAQVMVASTDSEFVHLAWRQSHPQLRNISIPMLSDITRELSTKLGILDPDEGVAQRVLYILDEKNIIRFVYATDMKVGRSPKEVLRVLAALQTEELCGCDWQEGEDVLHPC